MPAHEHQWVFAGEVVIPTKSTELVDSESFHRLEYCVACGAFRIKFKSGWRFWYSDATKTFLEQFDRESHRVLKIPPPEFKLKPPSRPEGRLGRGLQDITKSAPQMSISLFGGPNKRKPDAKD